ncbi:MAG TPA: tetratricopeptide repeat protein [Candidatus Saccharimonadales bacterium]|nr:tetratricopeptide repeat protein [Candidatus Saccharimonadales bacterium]
MMAENEKTTGPAFKPPLILSPWLVALAALGLYGLTLNHWVTFGSLPFAAQITGWDWHPGPLAWRAAPQYPLFFILTYPLRWLPAGWQVTGWNVFTAACAALTLAMLARSVRLLAHDRTGEQRQRQLGRGGPALLSVRAAFLPAAFAVLLLAAQWTFWENSISGTGEMIDEMVFAFLILCLLEFRVSRSERRLNLFAFVYGLGMANNWALIGYFPCFFLALLWIKGKGLVNLASDAPLTGPAPSWIKRVRTLFNWGFVVRMIVWGVLGLLLYGLIPLLGAASHDGTFWALLHQKLAEQHGLLTRTPRYFAAVAGMMTLVPLCFASIRWRSFLGQTRALFRVLHLVFLAVAVLIFFDVRFSPSPRNMGMGSLVGSPGFLSFYYLAALSVGYFSGYVLLVFGRDVSYTWGRASGILRVINGMLVGLVWVAAIVLPAILFYVNYQHVRDFNRPVVAQFAKEMAEGLPAEGAIVLADDPARLALAMGASQRLGLAGPYAFIDTESLPHREYLRYLINRYPALRRELKPPDSLPEEITSQQISVLLARLAQGQRVYYLHPSFGSYFEQVCMTPRRLGGDVHPYPGNVLATIVLTPAEIATNQVYWHAVENGALASLPGLARTNADAMRIAGYYSQILDYWGTELQKTATEVKLPPSLKAAMLKDAGDQFGEALQLNPGNVMARANQQYNAHLRGAPPAGPLVNASDVGAQFNNRWDLALNVYGPGDTPDLDIQIGRYFGAGGVYLQAAHLFQRCLELAPNDPLGELGLANAYIDLGLADTALALLRAIPNDSGANQVEIVRMEALAYSVKHDFAQADQLLIDEQKKNPKDDKYAGMIAEFYRLMGYSALREGQRNPAQTKKAEEIAAQWFKKALTALDLELQLLDTPTANRQDLFNVNQRKAEIQMTMKDYPAAMITLAEMTRLDPAKPLPYLNHAICQLELNRLDQAKTEYQTLEKAKPAPSPLVYYGLAQIAQKQNDKPAAIRYDKLYLRVAPPNTLEFTNATQQLRQLQGG